MFITFFCKRDKHIECPRKWPVNEKCGPDEDCSFDMKMIDCECECHLKSVYIENNKNN